MKAYLRKTGAYRKAASGGLFGYFGLFNTRKHGDIHVYTGSLKEHLVFVRLKSGKQYLFSPNNLLEFLDQLECGTWNKIWKTTDLKASPPKRGGIFKIELI